MKKFLFGGLQKKAIVLVLAILILTTAAFFGLAIYQEKVRASIIEEAQTEQQTAITDISEDTMHQMLAETIVKATELQAQIADNDFEEIVNNIYMLQSMAQGLFSNRESLSPLEVSLPDPALEGQASSYVLYEAGVDYTQSEYLGIIAHMARSMEAMYVNSNKIDGLYIGLKDGTDLCVDNKPQNKYDESGNMIPFPVRQRPWYRGAESSREIFFTDIIPDNFSGKLLVTCSVPIIVDDEVIGVIGIDIIPESMSDFVESAERTGGFAYVTNAWGDVILAPKNDVLFENVTDKANKNIGELGNVVLTAFMKTALRETTHLTTVTINGKDYYVAGSPMPTVGWAVVSGVEKEISELPGQIMMAEYDRINLEATELYRDKAAKSQTSMLLTLVGLLLMAILVTLFLVNKIVRPIVDMTEEISNGSSDGHLFNMRDSFKTNDEIEVLATAFDDMSKKNKQYIEELTDVTREKERVSTELHMANTIQSGMLPHIFPPFPERDEFDLYAIMNPAREVGGDFYDFYMIDDDHLCVLVADVSGKGVPAALFMMMSKVIMHSYATLGQSAEEVVRKTNEALCANNQSEMFVTVWLGILEVSTGKLRAVNAGHEYPATKLNSNEFTLLKDKHGFVLGGMENIKFTEYELQLEKGDKIFVYTDGVPEAMNAEEKMFGVEGMIAALNKGADATPAGIIENVLSELDSFVQDAEQFDDVTMLCLEYKGHNS